MATITLWDQLLDVIEPPAPQLDPGLSLMSDTAHAVVWNLLDTLGDCAVEYRYAAAWRTGRLVGYVYTGEIPMMVIFPMLRDWDMAMVMTKEWGDKIRWADGLIGRPDAFILVSVDQVRKPEVTSKPHMSRNPHSCPVCKQPALVMATQVHCTKPTCKNYDREA